MMMAAFARSYLSDSFLSLQPTSRYPLSRQASRQIRPLIPQHLNLNLNTTLLAYKVMVHRNLERRQTCPGLIPAQP